MSTLALVSADASWAVGAKLARLIPESGVVALDASPTVRFALEAAGPRPQLEAITNGLATYQALVKTSGCCRPVLTGGVYDVATDELLGPVAMQAARRLATTRFIMSPAALDARIGCLETSVESAELKAALCEQARETVVAVPAANLGRRALAPSVAWSRIALLVTELDPSDRRLAPYRDLVEIL